jgi:hypothetical protein
MPAESRSSDVIQEELVRGQLLQCFRQGSSEGFREHLLRGITDPIHPLSQGRKRRFHPVLMLQIVIGALCAAVFLYFSQR